MSLIPPNLWTPVDVDYLEPTAELVVRSSHNCLVVAGPGAGKTELLAQRACFLLQTGTCPAPQRILAISFKRDAAKNLGDRVRERCGDRANRFDSYTLDAFAKSLVDRFMPALPEEWRPRAGYEVIAGSLKTAEMRDWLQSVGTPGTIPRIDLGGRADNEIKRIFDGMAHGHALPYTDAGPLARHRGLRWWREQLDLPRGRPSLTFPMLNRLAAYLLRCNPKLTSGLWATYGFVFLDEFQDTTVAQYDLIKAAFQASSAVMTAVGDSKQRIMVWAGAMADIFNVYRNDFGAQLHRLTSNFRSAPELVRMQHVIAQALEAETPPANATSADPPGSCSLMEFDHQEDEADYIATLIEEGIRTEGKKVRDFCVIVRQRTGDMVAPLKAALSDRGIRLRDESQLQDLLAEPAVLFLLAVLRLATRPRDAEAWEVLRDATAGLLGLDEEADAIRIERECGRLLDSARNALAAGCPIEALPAELIDTIGVSAFRSSYAQYKNASYLEDLVSGLSEALKASFATAGSPQGAVDDVVGIDVVPAMTIHKSKGLEFHTVIFLGLEDSQWWAFSNQTEEEKRGFFVAFSRAAERVCFTFCDVREERWGRRRQGRKQIGDLYTILKRAGVETMDLRN